MNAGMRKNVQYLHVIMIKVTVFIEGVKACKEIESHNDCYNRNNRIKELKKIINFTHVLKSSGKDIGSKRGK